MRHDTLLAAARQLANCAALIALLGLNAAACSLSLLWLVVQRLSSRRGVQSKERPRLLLVAPFEPGEESGGSKAVLDLLRLLRQPFSVDAHTVPKSGPVGGALSALGDLLLRPLPIPQHCRRLAFGDRSLRRAAHNHEIVIFEFLLTAVYLYFGRLDGQRIVIRDHEVLLRKLNMERRSSRGLARVNWTLRTLICYIVSAAVYSRADAIITLTEADRDAIAHAFPWSRRRVLHIPAPFDAPETPDAPPAPRGRDLLMLANFYHSPNRDGLFWFLKECAPHLEPGFTLHLCGVDGALRAEDLDVSAVKIVRHGFVEDTAQLSALAPLAIAPIVSGGGVRIKNLFLGSLGKALITTPLGNEGIDFQDGVHAIICSDGRSMAQRINAAARDPAYVARLGDAAKQHIRSKFRQDAILKQYQELLSQSSSLQIRARV